MIFTLHRYVFRELIKVFIPAAIALTMILSLGSILRPIQEYGVGPRQVVHLLGYFIPITLTFVLPIAALFASAFIYGRLACFNELDACKASGISLLAMVYPGLILALIVTISNLILSFYVMPAFVQRAEKSLKSDAQKILFRNIQHNGYYEAAGKKNTTYMVYADQADPESGFLSGVVITEMDKLNIKNVVTAEKARLKFNIRSKMNEVQLVAYNTYEMGVADEVGASLEQISLTHEFGSIFSDNIRFKKVDKLQEIRANPMAFYPIEKLAYDTYAQLIIELVEKDIADKLKDQKSFYRLGCGDKFVEFKAKQCNLGAEEQIKLTSEVVVRDATRQPLKTYKCDEAILQTESDKRAPTFAMQLYSAVDELGNVTRRPVIYGLLIPPHVESILSKYTDDKISEEQNILKIVTAKSIAAMLPSGGSKEFKKRQNRLAYEIIRTHLGITAEIHSRLVFGLGCVPMILIGIGLGVMKKDGHLLSAFGASVVPALLLIVCIMMGKNVVKNTAAQAISGVSLMWLGIVVLIAVAVVVYKKLLRN